ncbi:hypothetical protein [Streptomyces melanogenes]|uniref:hypothetical protein n=1 Tax=Streptomyces melanogenes TaxID=67326 RepID=UPI003790EFC2
MKDFLMQNGHLPTLCTNIHGGHNIQVGSENTQNNNAGFDPSQFVAFAREVLAAAPRVEIADALRGQNVRDASRLEEESTSPAPEPSRVRRPLDGLMDTLLQHSTDGVAQLLYETGRSLLT